MYRQVREVGEGREGRDHLTHLLTSRIVAEIDLGIVASPIFARTIPCDDFRMIECAYPTHTYFAKLA